MKNKMIRTIFTTLCAGAIATVAVVVLFVGIEPAVSLAGTATSTSQFTISQTVSSEIAFATPASNVIMTTAGGQTSIGGLTGGTTNGVTQVAVTTNNLTGYNMTIQASSTVGMIGNASSTNNIPVYASTTLPDYNFNVPVNKAYFGYTVNASTSADVVQAFKYSGTTCNTGSTVDSAHCWTAATTSFQIINRSLPTPSTGATTTLNFRVIINSNPNPVIPNDTYVATTTLTATTNP